MKSKLRILSVLLALSMLVSLFPAAAAITLVTPTPPSWCPADEYAVFENSKAYEPDLWGKILQLRELAPQGGMGIKPGTSSYTTRAEYDLHNFQKSGDLGAGFEYGILKVMDLNARGATTDAVAQYALQQELDALSPEDPQYLVVYLWWVRATIQYKSSFSNQLHRNDNLIGITEYMRLTGDDLEHILDTEALSNLSEERRAEVAQLFEQGKDTIYVSLDGSVVYPGYYPYNDAKGEWQTCRAINSRTMMPVRMLAELLGADVVWDGATQQVTMTRASDAVVMTLDSLEAMVNGEPVTMDVAPTAIDGRTYIPTRYVAEFFHQKVEWIPEKALVSITEDPEAIGDSNMGAWALPMGAMLSYMNTSHPERFGGSARAPEPQEKQGKSGRDYARGILNGNSWGIMDRADLIDTVLRMTVAGHNMDFLNDVAYTKSLTTAQYNQYLNSSGIESYMFPYTKQLGEKWGSKGIIAWDLFRMSNLVQWGYLAGYLTYPEALALMEPAARSLKASFSSWDEAYENYLDGYNWWARNNVLEKDIWKTVRGIFYTDMKKASHIAPIFDDSLFENDVVSVPNITAAGLAAELK